jgi:succinate-semialdehyde dehydrogenase / glutarate-semialdehyde dehydrogenase
VVLAGVPKNLLIGGAWSAASDGSEFPVIDPSSGETIASVSSATEQDGLDAVTAAHEAFGSWQHVAPRERSEILRVDDRTPRAAGQADRHRERKGAG